jgi:hypothetical protein
MKAHVPIGSRKGLANVKAPAGPHREMRAPLPVSPSSVMSSSAPRPRLVVMKTGSQAPPPALERLAKNLKPGSKAGHDRSRERLRLEHADRKDRLARAPKLPVGIHKPSGLDHIKSRKLRPRLPSGFADSVAVTAKPKIAVGSADLSTVPSSVALKLDQATVIAASNTAAASKEEPIAAPVLDVMSTLPMPEPVKPPVVTPTPPTKPSEPLNLVFLLVAAGLVFLVVRGKA